MKQTINVGQVVDDGTGDYIRVGAVKTRDNFDEIYSHLGDGTKLFTAGAWKTWAYSSTFLNGDTVWDDANTENYFDSDGNGQGPTFNVQFGESWIIDTTLGSVDVTLPPGVEEVDYGKAIRLRDVKGVWDKFNVTVYPDTKDSIKRVAGATSNDLGKGAEFNFAFQDLELVFTPPRHWEYVAQKYVNGLTFGDIPSVLRKAVVARQGQRDYNFSLMLNGGEYNKAATECYRRGNLLYYGDAINDLSDFGSVPLHLVPNWISSNPDVYNVGDLVIGDSVAGKEDRIWQCLEEHNSIGTWDETKWSEYSDNPNYATWATNTPYVTGEIVLKTYGEYVEQFECKVSHTSSNIDEDLTLNSDWKRLTNGDLAPLDGRSIRLRLPANEDDPIALVTYLSDVSSFRSSYEFHSVKIISSGNYNEPVIEGQIVQKDLVDEMQVTLTDVGLPDYTQYNPASVEVLLNGTLLIPPNTAGLSDSGAGDDYDYSIVQDVDGRWNTVQFATQLEDGDVVSIRWFDNVIGTLLSWDEGDDNILSRTKEIFVSREDWTEVRRFNKMSYDDPQNPSAANTVIEPTPETEAPAGSLESLFESIYPVGTVYTNANNPSNPSSYMGFGTWVRYGEGRVVAGWNSEDDGTFHHNNNNGNLAQAGGTDGSVGVKLTKDNIPELISTVNTDYTNESTRDINNLQEQYSLVARSAEAGGNINLNGCLGDPDTVTPLAYYNEEPIKVNHGQEATSVNVTQPFITAYTWIRTE